MTSTTASAGTDDLRRPTAAADACSGPADFPEFFATHRDALHRFLRRLTRNAADADDLVQETFLVAWRKRSQFDGRGSAEGWLRRTAFRTYVNDLAKRRRRDALDGARPPAATVHEPPADRAVADAEATAFLVRRIEEAVDGLPDGPREAFVLFRFEGLTVAQIADATATNAKTVETRLRRATELLAEKVRRYRESLPGM